MQNGGCHPTDGCYAGVPAFPGASFDYLSANVIRLDNGQTLFPSYEVRQFDGVKVGFIGIALEIHAHHRCALRRGRPDVPGRSRHHQPICQSPQGHGGTQGHRRPAARWGIGWTDDQHAAHLTDPFFANVVMKIDPEVDALITGHTHNAYNCQVQVKKNYDPMIVTGAGYNGRYLTDIDLTIAGTNGQVIGRTATNIPVETPYLTAVPDPDMKALLDQYRAASAPLANRVVGIDHGGYQARGNTGGVGPG